MRYLTIFLSLICMLFVTDAAQADKRVAFVVGNGAYKNVATLPNPPIDAKAMAAVLRNVGFDVVDGTNLTRDTMTERLLEFGKKAQGADVAVFFYAGPGIAISGTNYLLPLDAHIKPGRTPRQSGCSSMPAATIRLPPRSSRTRPPAACRYKAVSPK